MHRPVLAYFLTWTCYGTWLHGDPRGSVDQQHNVHGTPFLAARQDFVRADQRNLLHSPTLLNEAQRARVENTIRAHAAFRKWDLLAVNVRTNHVHVVINPGELAPEEVLNQLKAWSTRRLREANLVESSQRIWTTHGSTQYLWTNDAVEQAVRYVLEEQ